MSKRRGATPVAGGSMPVSERSETGLAYRYECKYLIETGLIPCIRDFVQPFLQIDRVAEEQGVSRYTICSLYLDTPGLDLYRQTQQGMKNRFKLRIRTYSELAGAPVFLEIKRRVGGIVHKTRCAVSRPLAETVLARGISTDLQLSPGDAAAADEFITLTSVMGCRPVLRVRYTREAYESASGDPLRFTLDTDLCYLVTLCANFSLNGSGWCRTPVDGAILEIKFTDRYPAWVGDLVRVFNLERTSIPKYCLSMERALLEGRFNRSLAADLPEPFSGAS